MVKYPSIARRLLTVNGNVYVELTPISFGEAVTSEENASVPGSGT